MTGVDRFAVEICRQLVLQRPREFQLLAPENILYKDIAEELGVKIIGHTQGYLWEQITLPLYLRKQGSPLLLNLCSIAPIFYRNNIVTLHDITWIRYPKTFSWRFRAFYNLAVPILCHRARHIFTVSEFSRREIASRFSLNAKDITLLYNAVNIDFCPGNPQNGKGKYFLAVSSAKVNKNFGMIIKSFQMYDKKKGDCDLYIIGDLESKVFQTIGLNHMLDNPRIKCLGRVSDIELIDYYRGAEAFVFPSLYEGFGLPALEAQACGTPVISSNLSAMPEVLRKSAILCNPFDQEDISNAMISITENKALRQNLIAEGLENVKRFSWEESARRCIEILSDL